MSSTTLESIELVKRSIHLPAESTGVLQFQVVLLDG